MNQRLPFGTQIYVMNLVTGGVLRVELASRRGSCNSSAVTRSNYLHLTLVHTADARAEDGKPDLSAWQTYGSGTATRHNGSGTAQTGQTVV